MDNLLKHSLTNNNAAFLYQLFLVFVFPFCSKLTEMLKALTEELLSGSSVFFFFCRSVRKCKMLLLCDAFHIGQRKLEKEESSLALLTFSLSYIFYILKASSVICRLCSVLLFQLSAVGTDSSQSNDSLSVCCC